MEVWGEEVELWGVEVKGVKVKGVRCGSGGVKVWDKGVG